MDAFKFASGDLSNVPFLRYVAGFDSTEIARQTGISASGVRTRLARILERLRLEIDHA